MSVSFIVNILLINWEYELELSCIDILGIMNFLNGT